MSARPQRDAGSGTVLVMVVAALVVLAGTVLALLGAVAVARHRAAGVADLAALAAAASAHLGQQEACGSADRVASAAGASLQDCRLTGDVAVVTAQVRPPGRLGELGAASATARAGPLEPGAEGADALRTASWGATSAPLRRCG